MEQDFLYRSEIEDTQKDQYLTFPIGNETYGIEIKIVKEIVKIQAITQMPDLPEYIKGIINLRGKIIPVMDVRKRFRKETCEYNDRTCIIVVDIHFQTVGLIVDSVSEVTSIKEEDIVPPPGMHQTGSRYIRGIGKVGNQVKLILDCEKLLETDELERLSGI